MGSFAGKLAFVTGGSSGIGLSTAARLAEKDCRVAIFSRDRAKLDRASGIISTRAGAASGDVHAVVMDVSDHRDVQEKIRASVEQLGAPDILINSAGLVSGDYFQNITYKQFDTVVGVNVYGTWNTISAVLPHMKNKGGGHIVNFSSMAGLIGMFGYSLYGTTKFAIRGLSECLRSELKRDNIYVSVVFPPEVKTPMIEEEKKTLPPEGRAVKTMAGLLEPDYVAGVVIKGLIKKRFMIIPGSRARLLYFIHHISNGSLTRTPSDIIIARTSKQQKKMKG